MNNSPDPSGGMIVGIVLFYGFFILLGLASFIFWIVEIVDVARREFKDSNTKLLWLLVVILAHGLGALIYYFAGKPQGWLPGETPLYPQYPQGYAPQYPPQYPPQGQYPPQSPRQEEWPPSPGTGHGQSPYPPVPPENRQE